MYSYGPGGEHSTSVAGEGGHPSTKEFNKLAELSCVTRSESEVIIGEVRESVSQWPKLARAARISTDNIRLVSDCHNKMA